MSRNVKPDSFLIIFDNLLDDGEKSVIIKRQRVRSKAELESIFREAGLIALKSTGRQKMPFPFRDVCAWALF